jgi:glucan phosphoethanolaminetransferase (alkaline phosphatase superfamily)
MIIIRMRNASRFVERLLGCAILAEALLILVLAVFEASDPNYLEEESSHSDWGFLKPIPFLVLSITFFVAASYLLAARLSLGPRSRLILLVSLSLVVFGNALGIIYETRLLVRDSWSSEDTASFLFEIGMAMSVLVGALFSMINRLRTPSG